MNRPLWINYALASALLAVVATTSLPGCATYEIQTPEDMVAVEKSDQAYVAMTHDGIVLRALVHDQGDPDEGVGVAGHDFWVASVRERMRTRGGYALLEELEVESANGHRGTRMEFGRDQEGTPYLYSLTIFVTEDHVHILDAGGRKVDMDGARDALDKALASYVVKE
jgi:hypothetical protein